MVKFTATREEYEAINNSAERMMAFLREQRTDMLDIEYSKQECLMDITACHANAVRLDLQGLLTAPDYDFFHDVLGIRRNLNRRTGKLENFFLPRTAEHV